MIETKRTLINRGLNLLLSIFSVIAIPYVLPTSDNTVVSVASIFLFLVAPIYYWYNYSLKKVEKRDFLFCIFPALFLSICLKMGRDLSLYGNLSYTLASIIKNALIILAISVLIYSVLIRLLKTNLDKIKTNVLEKSFSFFSLFCIFLIVWLPILMIFWPGIYTWDAAMQISQLVNQQITAHHPIIHTLFLNIIILIGRLTGSYYLGAVIHTVFQMIVCVGVNSYICSRLSTFKLNKYVYYLILTFYLFFPINMLTSIYITKDSLFSSFFFLLIFKLCEYYLLEKKELGRNKAIELIIIIVLVGLFRNNAIYALLATVPMLFFIKRKKMRRNLIFVFCLGSILTVAINQTLLTVTNAKPGMEGQMYSVPLQQLARSYKNDPDSFTKKEKDELFNYVPERNLDSYNPRISDYVKNGFTLRNKGSSTLDFLELWVKIGLKNKANYFDAFFMLTQGYWDTGLQFPDKYYRIPIVEIRSKDTAIFGNFNEKSWFPKVREKLIDGFYNNQSYKKLPILSLCLTPGFTVWSFILLGLFSVYRGFRDSYFIFVFLIMYFGTILLGPVALVRYIYPFMLVLPVMFVFVSNKNLSKNNI